MSFPIPNPDKGSNLWV